MKRVFVTGSTGCVGHYVVEALLERGDCELFLLARDPGKFLLPLAEAEAAGRVHVLTGDVLDLEPHRDLLATVDAVVHLATAWGDPISYPTNVDATLKLAAAIDPARARLLHFSTASILDADNRSLEAAERFGTDYIRSKYLAYQALNALPDRRHVVTLFPTLIFGGSERHPHSHLSRGLGTVTRWLPVLRHLTLDGSLHFIHAADIARMVSHLIDHAPPEPDLVLGNECLSIEALIDQLASYHGSARGARFDLTPLRGAIAALAGSRMNSWDRYSLTHQHFRYRATNPRALGLAPGYETIADVLDEHARALPPSRGR